MRWIDVIGEVSFLRCSEFQLSRFGLAHRRGHLLSKESPGFRAHYHHRSVAMEASSATGAVHRPGRGRVFDSIVDAVGDTPIVRLRKLTQQHGANATILAKL